MIQYTLFDPATGRILGYGTNTATALFEMRARMDGPVAVAPGLRGRPETQKVQVNKAGDPVLVELTPEERTAFNPPALPKVELLTVEQFRAVMAKRGIVIPQEDLQEAAKAPITRPATPLQR